MQDAPGDQDMIDCGVNQQSLDPIEQKAEQAQIESMVRFDETMKQVFQHCKQMLDLPNTGVREINRLVEKAIFSNAACPSPLLKFYYQLCENLGLEFCNREMLTLDQNVFK